MTRETQWAGWFLAGLLILLAGCMPTSYAILDHESFIKPGTSPSSYKRAAVLYVGYTSTSSRVQDDKGSTDATRTTTGLTEANAVDIKLYSNALMSAFSRRGVEILERTHVNDLVREQGVTNMSLVDMSDLEKVRKLGKILRCDLLIKGAIFVNYGGFYPVNPEQNDFKYYYGGLHGMTLTAVDTVTGELVWIETALLSRRISPDDIEADDSLASSSTVVRQLLEEMVSHFYGEAPRNP